MVANPVIEVGKCSMPVMVIESAERLACRAIASVAWNDHGAEQKLLHFNDGLQTVHCANQNGNHGNVL
jgi:hypothetical protein